MKDTQALVCDDTWRAARKWHKQSSGIVTHSCYCDSNTFTTDNNCNCLTKLLLLLCHKKH